MNATAQGKKQLISLLVEGHMILNSLPNGDGSNRYSSGLDVLSLRILLAFLSGWLA